MEKQKAECPDISQFERLIDDNWNERKHLAEVEFTLRGEIQLLVQQGGTQQEFREARDREGSNRALLAQNNAAYDTLIEGWAAETATASD